MYFDFPHRHRGQVTGYIASTADVIVAVCGCCITHCMLAQILPYACVKHYRI